MAVAVFANSGYPPGGQYPSNGAGYGGASPTTPFQGGVGGYPPYPQTGGRPPVQGGGAGNPPFPTK